MKKGCQAVNAKHVMEITQFSPWREAFTRLHPLQMTRYEVQISDLEFYWKEKR